MPTTERRQSDALMIPKVGRQHSDPSQVPSFLDTPEGRQPKDEANQELRLGDVGQMLDLEAELRDVRVTAFATGLSGGKGEYGSRYRGYCVSDSAIASRLNRSTSSTWSIIAT